MSRIVEQIASKEHLPIIKDYRAGLNYRGICEISRDDEAFNYWKENARFAYAIRAMTGGVEKICPPHLTLLARRVCTSNSEITLFISATQLVQVRRKSKLVNRLTEPCTSCRTIIIIAILPAWPRFMVSWLHRDASVVFNSRWILRRTMNSKLRHSRISH